MLWNFLLLYVLTIVILSSTCSRKVTAFSIDSYIYRLVVISWKAFGRLAAVAICLSYLLSLLTSQERSLFS